MEIKIYDFEKKSEKERSYLLFRRDFYLSKILELDDAIFFSINIAWQKFLNIRRVWLKSLYIAFLRCRLSLVLTTFELTIVLYEAGAVVKLAQAENQTTIPSKSLSMIPTVNDMKRKMMLISKVLIFKGSSINDVTL